MQVPAIQASAYLKVNQANAYQPSHRVTLTPYPRKGKATDQTLTHVLEFTDQTSFAFVFVD